MIRKDSKYKVMELFFRYPTRRFSIRQVEREAKVAFPSAARYTRELADEGIVKREGISNSVFFSADMSTEEYRSEKQLYNLRSIRPLVRYLVENYGNPPIILFGSYSRGEDTEESDIDLYVQSPLKVDVRQFKGRLGREVQLFVHKSLGSITNTELANNILNGIKLNGYIEVFK
jgi:predicted nucleotidyltransferase